MLHTFLMLFFLCCFVFQTNIFSKSKLPDCPYRPSILFVCDFFGFVHIIFFLLLLFISAARKYCCCCCWYFFSFWGNCKMLLQWHEEFDCMLNKTPFFIYDCCYCCCCCWKLLTSFIFSECMTFSVLLLLLLLFFFFFAANVVLLLFICYSSTILLFYLNPPMLLL